MFVIMFDYKKTKNHIYVWIKWWNYKQEFHAQLNSLDAMERIYVWKYARENIGLF